MKNNYAEAEKISNDGYEIEFGTILENAFNNFKKIAGIAGVSLLVIVIVLAVVFGGIFGAIYGFSNFTGLLTGLNPEFLSGSSLLIFFVSTVLMAGIFSPLNAGLIKMAHLANEDQSFGIETVFSYYKGTYFKELFLSGIIIAFASAGINYLLEYFGIKIVGTLFTYIVSFLTFLTIPLIIFSDLTAIQAITLSVKLVLKQPLILLGLLIVAFLFACIGVVGFCIGVFFTMPFLYSTYYSIYNAILPIVKNSELDEIGQNVE